MPLGVQTDFGKLQKIRVIDTEDKDVGRVIDFTFDKDYKLTKFILGGSFVEELKERLGLKPDDDPVVPIRSINTSAKTDPNFLKLSIKADELYNKLDPEAIDDTEIIFSTFCQYQVKCKNDEGIGKIVDALIEDEKVSFVLGDNRLLEFLEKVGLVTDYDLLLPPNCIASIQGSEIKINQTKEELTVLLKNQEIKNHQVLNSRSIGETKGLAHITRYSRSY